MTTDKTNTDDTKVTSLKIRKTDLTRIHEFKDSRGITNLLDALTDLLDQTAFANLSENDAKKLHSAAIAGNTTFEALCITGALQYADRLLNGAGKPSGADVRINEFVTKLIDANNAADLENKTAITQGVLADKERGGGFNRDAIKRFLTANKTMIDDHHAASGITDPVEHNRKMATKKRVTENKQKREIVGG
jgi:hypothetical protein